MAALEAVTAGDFKTVPCLAKENKKFVYKEAGNHVHVLARTQHELPTRILLDIRNVCYWATKPFTSMK